MQSARWRAVPSKRSMSPSSPVARPAGGCRSSGRFGGGSSVLPSPRSRPRQRRQRNRTRGRFRVEPSIGPVGLGAPRPASGSAGWGEGLRPRVRIPLLVGEGADEPEPTVPAAFRPKAVISFGGECGPTQRTASNRLAAQFQAVRIRSGRKPRPKMSSPAKMRHTGRRRSGRPKRHGQGLGPRRAGQR